MRHHTSHRLVRAFMEGLKEHFTVDRSFSWKDRVKQTIDPLSFWMNAGVIAALTAVSLQHMTYGALPKSADACSDWDYETHSDSVENLSGFFGAGFYLQWREYGYHNVPCAPFQYDRQQVPADENLYELWRI